MTSEELDELDKLEREATPGPWIRLRPTGYGQSAIAPESDRYDEIITCDSGVYGPEPPDANLIVALRNHARVLIDVAREEFERQQFMRAWEGDR